MMKRTTSGVLALLLSANAALAVEAGRVWKNPSCGCCKSWISHMAGNGFALDVTEVDQTALEAVKRQNGISEKHASCHTARIGDYVVEGHVPASAVNRLLAEKPDAVGLAVPGMPAGSPGMETDGASEAYDVLLIKKDGSSEVFEHVPAPASQQ
jgi:hypothetical protein